MLYIYHLIMIEKNLYWLKLGLNLAKLKRLALELTMLGWSNEYNFIQPTVSEQSQCLLLNTDKISVNIFKRAVTV